MINSKKKSIIMNEEKLINKKIIQFYNTDGVKKFLTFTVTVIKESFIS